MAGNWIESLRTELVETDVSTLKQLLMSRAESVDEIKKNQNERFTEDETKIKELASKLAAMKETLRMETQTLEHKNKELLKEKDYLEELEAEKKKLLEEIKQLEEKRINLKSTKPNLQDQQVLAQGRKKLNLYKDLTRIQWDYRATKDGIKGYVSNKRDYIHHFSYETKEVNSEIVDSLWHEIHLSTNEAKVRDENPNQTSQSM